MKDKIEEVIFYAIDQVYRNKQQYAKQQFLEQGLDISPEQWVVLKVIYQYEGIPQVELASKSVKDTASITRILDILQKKKLVERRPSSDDRRKYCIFPTAQGKELINKNIEFVFKLRKDAVSDISSKDLDITMQVLRKMSKNLE